MQGQWKIIFFIGLIFSMAAAVLLARNANPSFGVDLKTYYVGAAALRDGANPYRAGDMARISLKVDPTRFAVGEGGQATANLPGALLLFLPFTLAPLQAVLWLAVVLIAFSVPVCLALSARLLNVPITPRGLAACSVLAVLMPPVWRCVCVGQLTLPLVAVALWATLLVRERRAVPAAFLGLATLLKITCTGPLLFWDFLKGAPRARFALAAACALFVVLNAVAILHIGLHGFAAGWKDNYQAIFSAHGPDDPANPGSMRIDLQPLAARLASSKHAGIVAAIAAAVLALPLLVLLKRREGIEGEAVVCVLAYSLLVAYHRPYDAVLAIPVFVMLYQDLEAGRRAQAACRAAALLLIYGFFGDHNILAAAHLRGLSANVFVVRPLCVILLYLAVVIPALARRPLAVKTESLPALDVVSSDAGLRELPVAGVS